MKIAISNIAWDAQEDQAVAALMARYHIGGLEVAPTKIWPKPEEATPNSIADYRKQWEARGIRIVAMQALLFGRPDLVLFGEPAAREKTFAYLTRLIQLAAGLGAVALVFGSPKNRRVGDMPPERATEIAVDFFRRIGAVAYDHGTRFCIEPNPPAYGCDFVTTTPQARQIVAAVDHPGFRCHLDLGIMGMNGEEPAAQIERSFPWLAHFHVSAPQLAVVGEDSASQQMAAAAVLRRLGYDHWVSIEMRNGWTQPDSLAVETSFQSVTRNFH